MSPEMTDRVVRIRELAGNLKALLDEPEPGLITWMMFVAKTAVELRDLLTAQLEPPPEPEHSAPPEAAKPPPAAEALYRLEQYVTGQILVGPGLPQKGSGLTRDVRTLTPDDLCRYLERAFEAGRRDKTMELRQALGVVSW